MIRRAVGVAAGKDARATIQHHAEVEKGVIRSSAVLCPDPARATTRLAAVEAAIDKNAVALTDQARSAYVPHAQP